MYSMQEFYLESLERVCYEFENPEYFLIYMEKENNEYYFQYMYDRYSVALVGEVCFLPNEHRVEFRFQDPKVMKQAPTQVFASYVISMVDGKGLETVLEDINTFLKRHHSKYPH